MASIHLSSNHKVDTKVDRAVVSVHLSSNKEVDTKVEDWVVVSIHPSSNNKKVAIKEEDRVVASVHPSSCSKKVDTKVEEEAGGHSMEDTVAVVVGELHVVEWPLNSHMGDVLNTISRAEGVSNINNKLEHHSSNIVALVALEHLLVGLLGHHFPSCTKQPHRLNNKL